MRVIFCFFFLLIFSGIKAQTDTIETADRIYWSDWYKLEWADFKGQERSEDKVSASSHILLPFSYTSDGEVDFTLSIQAIFLKSKSWYKRGKENDVLQQHEQLHFDIAELHRRMIIKAVMQKKFNRENYESEVTTLVNQIWNDSYRDMQDKYDKETNYARIFRAQINWNRFVAQQLRNLEEYIFTELTVTFSD